MRCWGGCLRASRRGFLFNIPIAIHGREWLARQREWLARQMDTVGLKYRQPGNCFVWIENYAQAQKLLEEQLQTNWAELLNGFAEPLNPIHESRLVKYPTDYYWTVYQSEWACARGVGHGRGVRRGRYSGAIPAYFAGTVETDWKRRQGLEAASGR